MLKYELTKKQYNILEGLSYWVADQYYLIEKYGINEPEIEVARKTIHLLFDQLDEMKVPFFVQNIVIAFSEEWRNTKKYYLIDLLKSKNVTIRHDTI